MLLKIVVGFIAIALGLAQSLSSPLSIGEKTPDFTLKIAGRDSSISLYQEIKKYKYTVLMFISTRCPYCQGFNTRKTSIAKNFIPRGIQFIGINSNSTEDESEVVSHAQRNKFPFETVKDHQNRVADLYGAERTPEIFILDPQGILKYHGRIDENYTDETSVQSPDLINALNELLSGKDVSRKETKAFGCTIKRI